MTGCRPQHDPLQEIEAQFVRGLHGLGDRLLVAPLPLVSPTCPSPDVACPCGQMIRSKDKLSIEGTYIPLCGGRPSSTISYRHQIAILTTTLCSMPARGCYFDTLEQRSSPEIKRSGGL